MKNYNEVVNDRYDQETEQTVKDSIYSENHPIGKYSRKIIFGGLNEFTNWFINKKGPLNNMSYLDVGCGGGEMTHFFSNKGFLPENSFGIDLSEIRIKRASNTYKEINFTTGNAINYKLEGKYFDLITCFDVFSHLTTKEDIIKALKNSKNHLKNDGLFLWYDIYSKDHFAPTSNSDSFGFNRKQMLSLSEEAGFEVVYKKSFFKLFFNKYHSLYQAKRLPSWLLRFLELTIPSPPGNIMMVMKIKS